VSDPIGATFDQIYNGRFQYLIWNDQFYKDPKVPACSGDSCGGPWGHSKGVLAWNEDGEGLVLQVTTPSWPGSGSKQFERERGNTLGCISRPNNVQNAQHFFALKLTKNDLAIILRALANASVVTDIDDLQLVNNGGPAEIKALVQELGKKSESTKVMNEQLSTGITLVSKPSALNVPPWQMLSSVLGTVDLRTATWWASPQIPTTIGSKKIGCWDPSLTAKSGAVKIATTGRWDGKRIGLIGGQNHAKIGVSISDNHSFAIFSDLNQQGRLTGNCKSSQNGRGGLFYVLNDKSLFDDMTKLLDGKTAATTLPKKKAKAKAKR
jgi:Deoxyribonuclease II